MELHFYKFDGAGNDFVLLDARHADPLLSVEEIAHICHRRFGVGADGLMTLHEGPADYDFEMRYYNSDGHTATMCGNGGRCIAVFAHLLGVRGGAKKLRFQAPDGPHEAEILSWDPLARRGVVCLGLKDVPKASMRQVFQGTLLDTGVPHYVQQVKDLDCYDLVGEGRRIRHLPQLGPAGANVNFVEPLPDGKLHVRTYERGVEDETWSCGTGVTACALVTGYNHIHTSGGDFHITFDDTPAAYTHVRLTGPVALNFIGTLTINR